MQRSKRSESASTFEEEAARLRAYMASRSHGSLPAVVVVNTDRRSYQEKSNYFRPLCMLKFMFSKKATQIDEIFTVDLTLCCKCQIDGEDLVNFCGLLRKYEL